MKDTSCGDPVKVNSCQNGNSNQFITAKFLKLSKGKFLCFFGTTNVKKKLAVLFLCSYGIETRFKLRSHGLGKLISFLMPLI